MVCKQLWIAGLMLLPAFPAHSQGVLSLTVDEAVQRARTNNLTAHAAREDVRAAEGVRLSTMGGFLPSVRISETFMRTSDAVAVFGSRLRQERFTQEDFALDALNRPDPINNAATALSVRQPLFSGGASWANRRAAGAQVEALSAQESRVQDMLTLEARKAYYGLAFARSQLSVIQSAVDVAVAHVNQASAMQAAGTVPVSDVLSARVREQQLREEEITVRHMADNAADGLRLIMGMPPSEDAALVLLDSLTRTYVEASQDQLERNVAEQRPDLHAQSAMVQAANHNIAAARSGYLPQANLMAQFEMNSEKLFGKDGEHWGAFVELSWDLFSGLQREGRLRQAKAQFAAQEYRAAYALDQARLEVRNAWRRMVAAEGRIGVAEEAVAAAEESLRMVELQYNAGLATVTRLLETEAALTEVRGRLLQALHDHIIGIAELECAAGVTLNRRVR